MTKKQNKLVVPGAQKAVDQLRMEIANEFNVPFGKNTPARYNGEVTKRLVAMAENELAQSKNTIK